MKTILLPNNCKMVEYSSGTIEYFDQDGKFHREDGPAIIHSDGSERWFLHGELFAKRKRK